jgi:hypothetical protein
VKETKSQKPFRVIEVAIPSGTLCEGSPSAVYGRLMSHNRSAKEVKSAQEKVAVKVESFKFKGYLLGRQEARRQM